MSRRNDPQCRMARLCLPVLGFGLAGFLVSVGLAEPSPSAVEPAPSAAILPLHGEITDVTVQSLKRRLHLARSQGAKIIILDMDTPGGLVTSSIAVADLIRNLTDVKTVAWVNPNAHSGGALVAMACDEIVMARSSRIGDSQVIMGGPSGVTAVPLELQPKAYTPVLHDFRTSARKNGYSQVLCEALVVPDREVWWLENLRTGEREFVFRDEKIKRVGDEKPGTTPSAEGTDADPPPQPQWKLVEEYYDSVLDMDVPTLQPVVRDDQLLEMSPSEAIAYGFSKRIVADDSDLRAAYGLGTIVRIHPLWSESLAHWLTSIYVRGFLLIVIFMAAYVEFHTPGVGLAGLVALIALAIFVGAPYVTGLASVWEIVLIFVGLALICLEVFVIPGFGVAGVSGLMMVLSGLIATFIPDEPGRSFPQLFPALPTTVQGLKLAIATLISSMVASLLGIMMVGRFLPRVPVVNKLVPANPTPSQVAVEDPYRGMARVGDIGQGEGPLRPAGKARFGSVLVDVVTEGEFLEANCPIEVIERRGNRVVVRAIKHA